MGAIVDSGIYRYDSLCSLADRYDNPMPESTLSLQSGTMNLATDDVCYITVSSPPRLFSIGSDYAILLPCRKRKSCLFS